MRSFRLPLSMLLWFFAARMLAQHEHHPPAPNPTPAPVAPEDAPAPEKDRNLFQSDMSLMNGMTPRDRMAGMSMPGWHVMVLGIGRLSVNRQGGPSGGTEVESSNWNMVHAQRPLGRGRLSLMLMNSLEPATYAARGSRELFQTGESYRGEPLVDRQHPHDFFMNLSATYRIPLAEDAGAWVHVAPVGEPALGPVAFMHRASAGENPTAPLGHHWQDSTHIAYNVVTVGAGWRWLALEGSVFHGAEPDEHRWNIDGGGIDSASGRARLSFENGWSGEISYGFLNDPEELAPGDTRRTTAALAWGAEGDRPFAATLLWGRNAEAHGTTDAYLLEGAYQVTGRDQVFGRAELVEKDFELLATKEPAEAEEEGHDLVRIGAYTLGYLRDFDLIPDLRTGAGVDLTAYSFPSRLEPVYGSFPVSFHVFLRLRWGRSHGSEPARRSHEHM